MADTDATPTVDVDPHEVTLRVWRAKGRAMIQHQSLDGHRLLMSSATGEALMKGLAPRVAEDLADAPKTFYGIPVEEDDSLAPGRLILRYDVEV